MNLDPAGGFRHEKAKFRIDTLSDYVGFGGGSYKMTGVKRMTATSAFLDMPLKNRRCEVELFQDCRTRKLLEECNCVPWEVEASLRRIREYYKLPDGIQGCTPQGRDCIEAKSSQDFNCSFTCEGVYIDHIDVGDLKPGFEELNKGNNINLKHFSTMINEYKKFKKSLFSSFNFRANANSTKFGS